MFLSLVFVGLCLLSKVISISVFLFNVSIFYYFMRWFRAIDFDCFFFSNSVVGFSHASSPASTNGPQIIDPQERIHEMQRKIKEEMSSSELVQQAILMGFTKELIKTALKR